MAIGINRATRAGLSWPLPDELSDEALDRLLFPPPSAVPPDHRPLPFWPLSVGIGGRFRRNAHAISGTSSPYAYRVGLEYIEHKFL